MHEYLPTKYSAEEISVPNIYIVLDCGPHCVNQHLPLHAVMHLIAFYKP